MAVAVVAVVAALAPVLPGPARRRTGRQRRAAQSRRQRGQAVAQPGLVQRRRHLRPIPVAIVLLASPFYVLTHASTLGSFFLPLTVIIDDHSIIWEEKNVGTCGCESLDEVSLCCSIRWWATSFLARAPTDDNDLVDVAWR